MFEVDLKINGRMIGHIYGHNEGEQSCGDTLYRYEYYRPESREIKCGTVMHERSTGIEKLVASILNDYGDNK